MNRFDTHDADTFRAEELDPVLTDAEQDEANLVQTIDALVRDDSPAMWQFSLSCQEELPLPFPYTGDES